MTMLRTFQLNLKSILGWISQAQKHRVLAKGKKICPSANEEKGIFIKIEMARERMDLQCIFEACGYEKAGENHDDDDAAAQHLGISWNYLGRRAAGSCATAAAASGGLLPCPFPVDYT